MPQVPSHPSLQAAIRHLERTDSVTLARQAELSALAAPTGSEGRRAARVAELFRGARLRDVFVDEVGNVHGWHGEGESGAAIVLVAHLDTAFSVANPATAVGRAVQRLAELPLAAEPRTTCAVVRLGGGTGLNSIPQEAWLDLDLRSEDPDALTHLDAAVQLALTRARDEENARRAQGTMPLALDCRIVGDRPCGLTRADHPLVKAAVAATRALGKVPELAAASTDANVPIARRIPAIALGAGGRAGDAHLPSEWYENEEGVLGPIRALMVLAAIAGLPTG